MSWLIPLLISSLAYGAQPSRASRWPAPGSIDSESVEVRSLEDEPIEVDLVELTSIDWKPGQKVPKKFQELDGKRVVIKGVMALGTVEGVDNFQLVNDGCNCGTGKVQHFVQVTLAEGVTQYTPDEITVSGTFSVGELVEDGFVVSLFRLKDATIE